MRVPATRRAQDAPPHLTPLSHAPLFHVLDTRPNLSGDEGAPEWSGSDFMLEIDRRGGKPGRGERRYAILAFTEQGVAMLSSVLRTYRAVQVNIEIMRAFVRLRELAASHRDLARKLEALERKYDAQFKAVFDAIRRLMAPVPSKGTRQIGFCREASSKTPVPGTKSQS